VGLAEEVATDLGACPMQTPKPARTTVLYDRRQDQVSLDEVERILI